MYSVRRLRQVIKDIADLPKDYARLISQHIDGLGGNPRVRKMREDLLMNNIG
ncbi:MAG TPA: hypothetical protein VNM22_19060 [Candidatus Limnocylindrales bacterium]|nr:hypothetical protein [Candidatus Limnocylindrales bacterium]